MTTAIEQPQQQHCPETHAQSDSCKMVVGVHNGHNAAAALVRDGILAFALQEERLTRVKNQGGLPKLTLQQIVDGT